MNSKRFEYLALGWYASLVCTLVFAALLLVQLSFPRSVPEIATRPHYQLYKALPTFSEDLNQQVVEIGKEDGRALLISEFFKQNKSPLSTQANKFVEVADRFKLDFRLLPSISMQESNGGKILPLNSFNPFGFGIYGGKVLKFDSFESAIERVGMSLRKDYIDQGLNDPFEIMAKYTPPSLEKGGAWAKGVSTFMEQLQ